MSLSMAPLLMHSAQVPAAAREALRAALDADPDDRRAGLESAARILHGEVGLVCSDALELVGLGDGEGDA
jgi:hypothetical protein